MLISLNWIKEFTNLPTDMSAKDLGIKFTMATAEVEEVIKIGEHWSKVKVVEVVEKEKHPEADKLNLVTFKVSDSETFRVVCGASNVKIGMKTPYAPIGLTLPNGLTLEPKKIRGVLSEGMLCSEEELGLAESSEGILELPSDAPVGQTLLEYFNENEDILLDIDNKSLTHRPDLWGHYGMAREFSAIFKNELKNPFDAKWEEDLLSKISGDDSPMKVKVEEGTSCLSYFGLSLDNVTVCESPNWIKARLNAVGLRPINNIVDISNYVMLELGMPLHIFDRDLIQGNCVVIKNAIDDENFVTLDEQERVLKNSDTVICDSEKPLVLAGIMGGLNSGVNEKTKNIFIEVANWKAAEVRKTSTRLGLRTDSSQRYEKTLDGQLCKRTLLRTLELVLKACPEAKVIGKIEYDGVDLSTFNPLLVKISMGKIQSILGNDISEDIVTDILKRLDFRVSKNNDVLTVTVPSYRSTKDIECDADIIEEIGRIIGYDNIVPLSPKLEIFPVRLTPAQQLHRELRSTLVNNANALEINSYAMVGEKLLKSVSWPIMNEKLCLINSLSKDHDRMRPSLVPSFLEVAGLNSKNFSQARFFEIGRAYLPSDKNFSEESTHLGMCFIDKSDSPFVSLVNSVEKVLNNSNIPFDLAPSHPKFKNNLVDESWNGIHPFEFYNIRIMGKMDGVIFSLHPLMAKKLKIKGNVSIAIVDLSKIQDRPLAKKVKYSPLPKFPGSTFDYTLELELNTQVGDVIDCLKKLKIKEIKDTKVVDIYTPDNSEKKYLTLKTEFIDQEKTLSGDFLKQSESMLINHLEKNNYRLKQ